MRQITFLLLPLLSLLLAVASCRGRGGEGAPLSDDGTAIEMRHAVNLSMRDCGDYLLAEMRNPWDTLSVMRRYALVPRDAEVPSELPEGTTILRTPMERAIVYSAVHIALLDELGRADMVKGVCDPTYIYTESVRRGLEEGSVVDCGSNLDPDLEKIVSASPEAILLSPYEGARDFSRLERLGVSVVECADYMEPTPLGRAEWIRFYGQLVGESAKADSIFAEVERDYTAVRTRVGQNPARRPRVMTDIPYQGVWYVPGGRSTFSNFIADAGGENIFSTHDTAGSPGLSPEQVLIEAENADIWLVRYNSPTDLTLAAMAAEAPVYARFRPWKEGNVWGANSARSRIFDDLAFHPERLVRDLAAIFHPEADSLPAHTYSYFTPLPMQ